MASSLLNLAGKAPVNEGPAKVQSNQTRALPPKVQQNAAKNQFAYSRPGMINKQAANANMRRSPTIDRITSKAGDSGSGGLFAKFFGGGKVAGGNQINSKA